ncbi:hypothetical protein F5Y16DRAFT_384923 [Xylariaceae sp. FL0255]|nr:hypothetical protein F5Y16DRAFT_384923 [Xylariaceae sp. FL0255]
MGRDSPTTEGVETANPPARENTFQRRPSPRKNPANLTSKDNAVASDDGSPAIARPLPSHRHRQSDSSIPRLLKSPTPSLISDQSSIIFSTPRHSVTTTRGTRIPRPKTTVPESTKNNPPDPASPMREPMSLSAAFRRAQEQTAAEKDNSPDSLIDLRQAFNMANAEFNGNRPIDGSPSPAPRSFRQNFYNDAHSKKPVARRNGELNAHLQQFDRNHQLPTASNPHEGLFTKNTVGAKVSETGRALVKKASDSSLGRTPERNISPEKQGARENGRGKDDPGGGSRRESVRSRANIGDIPIPSIEHESASDNQSPVNANSGGPSPDKNSNWQLDADFTAGDLQVSESPRVRVGLDRGELKAGTTRSTRNSPARQRPSHQSNDRLTQLQQREAQAAKTAFAEELNHRSHPNSKLDEIRAREMEALSKRAVASSRLDEIRIKNSESRSVSPESSRKVESGRSKEGSKLTADENGLEARQNSARSSEGEPIPNTPVVVYKSSSTRKVGDDKITESRDKENKREILSRSDSHDLLRRLARATSSSPPAEKSEDSKIPTEPAVSEKLVPAQVSEAREPLRQKDENKPKNPEIKNPRDRLSVGFANLRHNLSSDSVQEKRSSMPLSDMDPTDRIEAELKLFAPLDNYSEKGSIRAPSPALSDLVDEETPRAPKVDPLTMPTPRVTGAYVETPATVRTKEEEKNSIPPTKSNLSPAKAGAKGRTRPLRRRGSRSSSAPSGSRRSRSSSRRRHPLINTAKPPTVREDILSILRAYEIDDSTLENLDSILASKEAEDHELEQMVNDSVLKVEEDLDFKFSDAPDRARELEAYDRMSKSLKTGLLGIRSAKKGIERLEDKMNHREPKDSHSESTDTASKATNPYLTTSLANTNSTFVRTPYLYRRDPSFTLTPLGILSLIVMLWYALECTFCFLYEAPQYQCTVQIPCEWSPNEPYFPYTMPFMLDEWATGGKGRAVALRIGQEVGDIAADISDWITNTDFTQFDERYMDVWQRMRHRRRLRRRNLIPKWSPPPGYQLRFPNWLSTKSTGESAHEFEYDTEDETMSADEIVRSEA